MKLTNFGGATAILEHNGVRILFDPWLDDGIFSGAWYHYPPLRAHIEDVGHLDYIYISHIHEDHCSAGTIKYLNRDAEIILADRTPNFVANFLKSNKFDFKKIHLVKPQEPKTLMPELSVDIVTADPTHELNYTIDSGLIIKWDDYVIYNANDCPPYPGGISYIKKQYGKVDLALLTYAGGSGYPACFTNLSDSEKASEVKRIRKSFFDLFVNTVKELQPKYAMPFADQYVIAGSRSHLNKFVAHPAGPGAVIPEARNAGIEEKLLLLNSGQTFDLEKSRKSPDEAFEDVTETDRDSYVRKNLIDKKYEHELVQFGNSVPLFRLFQYARERLWKEQQKQQFFPQYNYYFRVSDKSKTYKFDLTKNEVVEWDKTLEQPYLSITASHTLFALMLIGQISWNIADAALFLDYERVPNQYDPKIHAFLNYIRV